MSHAPRRQKGGYFPVDPEAPPPLLVSVKQRISFSDADPMGILWHGRYARLFELANEALGRLCGMTYADFHRERLRAPIVQFHVDYFAPVSLAEQVTIVGKMLWTEGARMDIEYAVHNEAGRLAATGYTVQMFVDDQGTVLLAPPALQELCRRRWRAGELGEPR